MSGTWILLLQQAGGQKFCKLQCMFFDSNPLLYIYVCVCVFHLYMNIHPIVILWLPLS